MEVRCIEKKPNDLIFLNLCFATSVTAIVQKLARQNKKFHIRLT